MICSLVIYAIVYAEIHFFSLFKTYFYNLFQVFGLNKINTGRISNLPSNIVNVNKIFEKLLNSIKLE